jgi:nucleoside-diphosphate-sugar epimerase
MDAPVLLTGATGYIGGRLLRHFEEAGRRVQLGIFGGKYLTDCQVLQDTARATSGYFAAKCATDALPIDARCECVTWEEE